MNMKNNVTLIEFEKEKEISIKKLTWWYQIKNTKEIKNIKRYNKSKVNVK